MAFYYAIIIGSLFCGLFFIDKMYFSSFSFLGSQDLELTACYGFNISFLFHPCWWLSRDCKRGSPSSERSAFPSIRFLCKDLSTKREKQSCSFTSYKLYAYYSVLTKPTSGIEQLTRYSNWNSAEYNKNHKRKVTEKLKIVELFEFNWYKTDCETHNFCMRQHIEMLK